MSANTEYHPVAAAREEARRGNPAELAGMRDMISRRFGITIDARRLEVDESAALLGLHKRAVAHEGWEAAGARHYGLSRLEKTEQKRWRELVGKAAGHPGLLDDLEEDGRVAATIAALVKRATTPSPSSMAAPAGSAVFPPGVLDDLHAGKLLGLDLSLLGVIVATFASGRLHPLVEKRREARWGDDGELVVRSSLHRLLPRWDVENGWLVGQTVTKEIAARLSAAGWLEVETVGNELHVRLGERLAAGTIT